VEKLPEVVDVCIVCALPEEAGAFLEVMREQYQGVIEEGFSARYGYSYRFVTIKNHRDESLNLHISWLPRYGPQEMTLHLPHVLEECLPRIAIMTGICAGDAEQVQLGDLIVAERTFTYDNGKVTFDDLGRRVHYHDTLTYQLDSNILQFLGLFEDWKPLVARLKRPSFPPESILKWRDIRCHLKAMASGSAVRADHPFDEVRAPVRGTVAIDMEGAAFGSVMSHHPLIRWLVVKGVCDYADQTKNDTYHIYAARASALYALCFIQAYVTDERLPRPGGASSSIQTEAEGVRTVPHQSNPHLAASDAFLDKREKTFGPELLLPTRELWTNGSETVIRDVRYCIYHNEEPQRAKDGSALCQLAKARKLDDNRMVWLKQVRTFRQGAPEASTWEENLEQEAKLLDELEQEQGRFPRRLDLWSIPYEKTLVYVAFSGDSLASAFGNGDRPVDPPLIRRLLLSIPSLCFMLNVLHKKGKAHRMLTPATILLMKGRYATVQDVGLATMTPRPGEGPELYRAPEQRRLIPEAAGRSSATDMYQLGVLLYHMLTGHLPRTLIPGEKVIAPSQWSPAIPEPLDELLLQAIRTNPAERCNIGTFARRLREIGYRA
jgi:nucleoside phosphorylase